MKKYYPIAKPHIGKRELSMVRDVLLSGNLSLGPAHRRFEEEFAKKIGVKYACTVSSGTAGLHLAMIGAGIGPGDEVITSPFSFIASANSILYVGAKPVFVDIDPVSFNMDPALIEAKITKRTKAILVVHIFGQTAEMGPILKIAKKHRLKIIEDACESVRAEYRGKQAGTFGESAVFAFYPNKQMTTGEGGMIVTDAKKLYELFSSLKNQGRSPNMQWLDHNVLGYNYRMDEMSAVVGLAQLEKLDWMIKERIRLAELYDKYLKDFCVNIETPATARGNFHTWFVYVAKIKNIKIRRDSLVKHLADEGISTKPYLPSIHLFDFYRKKFNYKKGDFPVSETVSGSSIALPFYIGLKEPDVKYICGKLINTISKYAKRNKK
jgi:perosamine synthetase